MKRLLIELRDEMRPLLTHYGLIKEENYDKRFSNLDELDETEIEILYSWLLDFRTTEYQAMYRVFRLPIDNSPNGVELWDRYFELKKWHFPEMQMLRKEARKTRDKWKECPKFKSNQQSEDVPDAPEIPAENGNEDPYQHAAERVGV